MNSARTEDLLPGGRASRQEKDEEATERGGSPSASPGPQALSAGLKSLPKEETWHAPQDLAAHGREGASWQGPLLHLHPPLLPLSNISSCESQWSFLQVKKIQSPTHPTAINMSFVQVLRGTQKSRPATGHCTLINTSAAYNLACRTAGCFTIECSLGQPATRLKINSKMSPASSTKREEWKLGGLRLQRFTVSST